MELGGGDDKGLERAQDSRGTPPPPPALFTIYSKAVSLSGSSPTPPPRLAPCSQPRADAERSRQ